MVATHLARACARAGGEHKSLAFGLVRRSILAAEESWTGRRLSHLTACTTTTTATVAGTQKGWDIEGEAIPGVGLRKSKGLVLKRPFHFNAFYSASPKGSQKKKEEGASQQRLSEEPQDYTQFDNPLETLVVPGDHAVQDRYEYKIEVHTGELRGGGTTSNVYINLRGNLHRTGRCLLRQPDQGNDLEEFPTGSTKTFHLLAPNLLGRISGLELSLEAKTAKEGEKLSEAEADNQNWYVEKLIIYAPTGKRLEFPCKCWFGNRGRLSAPLQRRLIPFVRPLQSRLTSFGRILPKPMKIQSGVFVAPHPDKVKSGTKAKSCKTSGHAGEDAYFKCVSKNGLNYGMGVADGVYMWSEHGIDAGQFSKSLMNVAQEEVLNDVSSVSDVMKTAAERAKQNEILGSSTFCVTLIDTLRGTLQVSNLGDSGVLVLGKEGVKFKTIQQEHTFGCPFQLGHHDNSDRPEDALVSVVPVTVGDIIISGTDGLFDNLSEENAVEIAEDVRRRHPGQPPALIASMLANQLGRQAFQNSMDKYISTPYSEAATDAFDMVYSGGKPDDMTVLTAIICSATE